MSIRKKNTERAFSFSSKAETLIKISHHEDFHVPKIYYFTVDEWNENQGGVLEKISESFLEEEFVIIRSSCLREDNRETSSAGAYLSIPDVTIRNKEKIRNAIEKVIASYKGALPGDQVLVQPMLRDIVLTGVIMTRVLTDGTPYYVINYDDESGKTDTITGGKNVNKTVYVYRKVHKQDFDSPRLFSFVDLARRLEKLCGSDTLDIEFCLDIKGILHLLQVRPICTCRHWPKLAGGAVTKFIDRVADFVTTKTGPSQNNLFGQRSILGVMPDWNPAEMIGILPRPLASSLYRNLITSRVWATARSRMGYKPIPSTELMLLLIGRPYIDVRASLNSFLPNNLDNSTCEALVSAWIDRLDAHPQLHDKVEFEVAQTLLDFCFDKNIDERYHGLLSSDRRNNFRSCLQQLTIHCLDTSLNGSMNKAFEAVADLRNRQAGRELIPVARHCSLADASRLLDECRKYGTLPFSILARHAFMAESLLRSAVIRGALRPERLQDFKISFKTISGEMSTEFLEVCMSQRNPLHFIQKYGHLRPGTYDILSPRYADREDLFGKVYKEIETIPPIQPFTLTRDETSMLERLLTENGLPITPEQLLHYARRAITGRELAKFVFSRNLSDVLEIVAGWGEKMGLEREDMSFIGIETVLNGAMQVLPEKPQTYFRQIIAHNRKLFEKGQSIKLGYLIRSSRDVYVVPQHRAAPNFIGTRQINAPIIRLFANSSCDLDLAGKIICIENADPGFDWIFTRHIAGLVTKFGGVNSHMAIRCAEYGLPAAIGVGEQLFSSVSRAPHILLDPQASILKPY